MSGYRSASPNLPTCTAQTSGGRFCDSESAPDMPFPICPRHALQVFNHLRDLVDNVKTDPAAKAVALAAYVASEQKRDSEANNTRGHLVYYVRVGDLIKIGTTRSLPQRLRSYPPDAEMLATEPGGTTVETKRLAQFAHLRSHRKEWFNPGADLLDHIAAVRKRGQRDARAA